MSNNKFRSILILLLGMTFSLKAQQVIRHDILNPMITIADSMVTSDTQPAVSIMDIGCGDDIYVKTNIPAWGMLWSNIQGEINLSSHWSAQLAIYYSGWNYFTSTRKFRTFTLMPEIRWWANPENQGLFIGGHLGMSYYNVAFGGRYRYQDHNRKTPALGGGLNIGYRLPITNDRRWFIEFSLGAGVYSLDYDRFENRNNGFIVDRRHDTFFGIDNAAISLSYRFDRKRKGGVK